MECNKVKKEIDFLLFKDNSQLSKQTFQHLEDCQSCREHYELTLLFFKISDKLKAQEPVLSEPSRFTEEVLSGINQPMSKKNKPVSVSNVGFIFLQRVLAAASVCLFLVFGFEQFHFLSKINQLETENQKYAAYTTTRTINPGVTWDYMLLLTFQRANTNPENFFKKLKLENYSKRELLIAYNQVKQDNFSARKLNQLLGTNLSSVEANRLLSKVKVNDIESFNSNNFKK